MAPENLPTNIRGNPNIPVHSALNDPDNLVNPEAIEAHLRPARRHRIRLQRQRAQLPDLQFPSDPVFPQPQRQDRRLLRPPRHLRGLPEPASDVSHRHPPLLSGSQGGRRLVPLRLRDQRPRRSLQFRRTQPGPVKRQRFGHHQD